MTCRRSAFCIAAALAVFVSGFALPSVAVAPANTPQKTAPLVVSPEKGVTVTAAAATWDFGKRTVHTGDEIAHTFTLRNVGTTPLRIETPQTSCHCTTATLVLPPTKKTTGTDDDSFTLAPGKTVGVRIAVDTDVADGVDFHKMVWVYVKGRDEAALTITVAGSILREGEGR